MLSRSFKENFYKLAGPIMRLNAARYRVLSAPLAQQMARVHLGPGQRKYMRDWINVDANMFTARCDVWADLRYPLPFRPDSVDSFYSHHMIEHLPSLRDHFAEVHRCLTRGGAYRIAGPNGDSAIKKFYQGEAAWFGEWPDKRRSIGGRFENFVFCRGEHVTILTFSFIEELLEDAGFVDIRKCMVSKETFFPRRFNDCLLMEDESDFDAPHTLVVEASKP